MAQDLKKKKIIWKNAADYPPLLNETQNPPAKLFFDGEPLNPEDKYFAVVGTRHPSPYGKQMAEEFSGVIAEAGFTIVSGLALGIDAIAHETALSSGGKTVAVLGSGLNQITPFSNRPLAEKIKKYGTVISEYEENMPPFKGTFPQRNRIIAGMSLATLVIEAPEKSGALITARLALESNRDVFALPGNVTHFASKGTNKLIQKGLAYPVTCPNDIFEFLGCGPQTQQKTGGDDKGEFLKPDEKQIYDLLKKSSMSIDEIASETVLKAQQITSIISVLEIKGLVSLLGTQAFITR